MSFREFVGTTQGKVAVASASIVPVLAIVPGVALAEGETSTVQTGVTGMATTVANDGVAMINAVLPVLAPVIAAVIIATLGVKLVRRFAK